MIVTYCTLEGCNQVQEWFDADGQGYEHLDNQSIIALAEKDEDLEEEEEYKSPEIETERWKAPLKQTKASSYFTNNNA